MWETFRRPKMRSLYCHNSSSMLFNDAGGIKTTYRRWSWMWGQLRTKKCQWKLMYSAKTRSMSLCPPFTWSDRGANPGRRGEKPVTNHSTYGMAVVSRCSYNFNKTTNSHFEVYLHLLLNQGMGWYMQHVNGLSRSTSSSIYVDCTKTDNMYEKNPNLTSYNNLQMPRKQEWVELCSKLERKRNCRKFKSFILYSV
jgi:hypothetical protein